MFFFFNYPQGLYGASRFNPAVSKPEAGVIRIAADARIPTVVMQMFGFSTLPVAVSCDASLNFVNTDIVLVLDVTGSMNDRVDGTRKIEALQDAVMALYDELAPIQAQLASQGLRLRYGVVPYSSTVNVGRLLYADDPANLRANVTVPSRVSNMTKPVYTANTPTTRTMSKARSSSSSCRRKKERHSCSCGPSSSTESEMNRTITPRLSISITQCRTPIMSESSMTAPT